MDNYININALDVEFKIADRPAYSFEEWAELNNLNFIVKELDAMDPALGRGTHMAQMFSNNVMLHNGYGDGILEALIDLAKGATGITWKLSEHDIKIEAPMKFKGI